MTLGGLDRRSLRHALPLVLVVVVVGLLHRRAAIDVWVDDRALAAEPSWYQVAAPLWHSAVGGGPSLARTLTALIDPLTGASTAGDVRALAALITGLAAASLFLVLHRAAIPRLVAAPLCLATVSPLLPVVPGVSLTYALQLMLSALLILTWTAREMARRRRLAILTLISLMGAFATATFLPFAIGIWVAEVLFAEREERGAGAAVGAVTLVVALVLSSWLLSSAIHPSFDIPIDQPSLMAMIRGLVTGRFDAVLQPSHDASRLSALALSLPGPTILCGPLLLLGLAQRPTRAIAAACLIAAAASIVFSSVTWLPDPHVATAPARIALVIACGLGLSWIAAQAARGAKTLSVVTAIMVGLGGYISPVDGDIALRTAEVHAFVETAPQTIGDAAWAADRLAVNRALLTANPALASQLVPLSIEAQAHVPSQRAFVAIGNARVGPDLPAVSHAPVDVAFPSAAAFLATMPARHWMAVAVRGDASGSFCNDVLTRLGSHPPTGRDTTLLAQLGDGTRQANGQLSGSDRLDVEYGRSVAGASQPVPARFVVEAAPTPRVIVNRKEVGHAPDGMLIATFDPWTADTYAWPIGSCTSPTMPLIADRRLNARYIFGWAPLDHQPQLPALTDSAIRIRLDDRGDSFGDGWHGAEGAGDAAFRWTSAPQARVNVAVARPQAIRVRMNIDLAAVPNQPNGLALLWNDTVVRSTGPWSGPDGEWVVPAAAVQRGINVLTIQVAAMTSPAPPGMAGDTRALGALVRSLSFEPAAR